MDTEHVLTLLALVGAVNVALTLARTLQALLAAGRARRAPSGDLVDSQPAASAGEAGTGATGVVSIDPQYHDQPS